MESASSTVSASQLSPQSPFDSYRDPFYISSSRRDTGNPPESWSSEHNNSSSPLRQHSNHHNMDGSRKDIDLGNHGIQNSGDGSSSAHKPKKKRFVCPHCARTFARSGHLQRHERSRRFLQTVWVLMLDTNERPFQ